MMGNPYIGEVVLENHHREQYFFSYGTATELAALTASYNNLCCLCTPTVFQLSVCDSKALLDIDPRVIGSENTYPFDMNQSIFRQYNQGEWNNYYPIKNKFDCVIIDPPFDGISLKVIANQLQFLCDFDNPETVVYLIHQKTREPLIKQILREIAGLDTKILDLKLIYQNPGIRSLHERRPAVVYKLTKGY